MKTMYRRLAIAIAFIGIAILPRVSNAQDIPGPIRLIVPYTAGGGSTDLVARLIAPYLSKALGQPVIVENHPGASGSVGLGIVARARPDGTTLGVTDSAFVTNPSIYRHLPYDTLKAFTPIVLVAQSAQVLLVNPKIPAHNVAELVALAKANPGKYTYASAGYGTAVQIAAEQFRVAAGLNLVHVPYPGLGPALVDTISGQVSMVFGGPHTAKPYAASGQLRPLAITGDRRSPVMPNVPTFSEAGYPSVDIATTNGIVGPAGMPPALAARINKAVVDALHDSAPLQQKLDALGLDPIGDTPQAFAQWTQQQIAKWHTLAAKAGLHPV
jgi:tripartite-type tricarboxylate transporter receptor subunit TctC